MKQPTLEDREAIETYLLSLQAQIVSALEGLDGVATFRADEWVRQEGGGGRTMAIADGPVFEKGGVNFSRVQGGSMPASGTAHRPDLANAQFEAMGVSLVIHPRNPYVPTTHMNIRFFQIPETDNAPGRWWFGGGFDLTPYYGFQEDCIHWHQVALDACHPFGAHVYPGLKKWCDEYFFLKHRNEARGIGGLFFDDWNEGGFEKSFAFMRSVGDHFLKAYLPIVKKRKELPYTEREQSFQRVRRGRYVEYNLLYDRGTLFGIQSGGRTESILMSLPPEVNWVYDYQAPSDGVEGNFVEDYLRPRDWLKLST